MSKRFDSNEMSDKQSHSENNRNNNNNNHRSQIEIRLPVQVAMAELCQCKDSPVKSLRRSKRIRKPTQKYIYE